MPIWFKRNHVILPTSSGIFYILYSDSVDWFLYKVSSITPGGGSAALAWTQAVTGDWTSELGLAVPHPGTVIFGGGDASAQGIIHQTTDNASSWSSVFSSLADVNNYFVRVDRTNRDLVWSCGFPNGVSNIVHAPVSQDSGASFININVDVSAFGFLSFANIAPLHDNDKCYVLINAGGAPELHVYRIDKSGGIGSPLSVTVSINSFFLFESDPGAPNYAYAIIRVSSGDEQFWKLDWAGASLAHVATEPWNPSSDLVAGLVVTTAGTIVATGVNGAGTVLTVYRSIDGGATWGSSDLTAYFTFYPVLIYTSDGKVCFVSDAGEIVYSSDDGVTWQATAPLGIAATLWDAAAC